MKERIASTYTKSSITTKQEEIQIFSFQQINILIYSF